MAAQSAVWGASWRNKFQAVLYIAIAVISLISAPVVLYFDRHDAAEISAYNSASVCVAPADAIGSQTCRYEGQANVVSTRRDIRLYAVVAFDSMPGPTISASWPTNTEPDLASLRPGATISAEVWNGKVTKLGGTRTVDSPENVPMGLWELSAFFTILGLPLLVFGGLTARSAWRDQPGVVPLATASTPPRLSARSRYAILAMVFLVMGTPLTAFLLINARSGIELCLRSALGLRGSLDAPNEIKLCTFGAEATRASRLMVHKSKGLPPAARITPTGNQVRQGAASRGGRWVFSGPQPHR